MSFRMCLSCSTALPPEPEQDDAVIRVVRAGKVLGVLCEPCQAPVKTFKFAFTRDNPDAQFSPLNFQCLEALGEDERKDRYDGIDVTRKAG